MQSFDMTHIVCNKKHFQCYKDEEEAEQEAQHMVSKLKYLHKLFAFT